MRRIAALLRQPALHVYVFCIMLMLVNWPFLGVPAGFGFENLFRYLFGLWSVVILLLFLIQRSLRSKPAGKDHEGGGG